MIKNKQYQLQINEINQHPLNQAAYQLLAKIQKKDRTQLIADYRIHLVQLMDWGINQIRHDEMKWITPDELWDLLIFLEDRLTPQKMMEEVSTIEDNEDVFSLFDESIMHGNDPLEAAVEIIEEWIGKKISEGIIQTRWM